MAAAALPTAAMPPPLPSASPGRGGYQTRRFFSQRFSWTPLLTNASLSMKRGGEKLSQTGP
uniref:Uncharacterized protein n=1 Tax=Arundo donax TaxID=35708 RepID=A0A0A9BN39_ARUDO